MISFLQGALESAGLSGCPLYHGPQEAAARGQTPSGRVLCSSLVPRGDAPEDYSTDVIAERAVELIGQADANTPLFLWIAPFACRNPAAWAPRHAGRFPNAVAPRNPSRNEDDVSDKPAWIQARPTLDAAALASQDNIARGRLLTLLAVDDLVEDVVEALESAGRLANAYIIVTSDHGYRIGAEHRIRHGKQTPYEEDIAVPFFIRGPEISAGTVVTELCILNDIFPTLLGLAGLDPPADVDGRSLTPLWTGAAPSTWRQSFLVQHWRSGQDQGIPAWRALRSENHLYVEWPASEFSASLERELYALQNDPWKMGSRHATATTATLQELSARLAELMDCSGDGCQAAEDASLPW